MKTPDKKYTTQHVASFTVYYQENRPKMTSKYPFLSADQINCRLRDQWKKLEKCEKKHFTLPKLCLTPSGKSSVKKKIRADERRKSTPKSLFAEMDSNSFDNLPPKTLKQKSVADWLNKDKITKPQTYSDVANLKNVVPEVLDRTPHLKTGILKSADRSLTLAKISRIPASVTFNGHKKKTEMNNNHENEGRIHNFVKPKNLNQDFDAIDDYDICMENDRMTNKKRGHGDPSGKSKTNMDNEDDDPLERETYSDSDDDNLIHYCQDDENDDDTPTQDSVPKTPSSLETNDSIKDYSMDQQVPDKTTIAVLDKENGHSSKITKTKVQKPLKSGLTTPSQSTRTLRPRKRSTSQENIEEVESTHFIDGISLEMSSLQSGTPNMEKNQWIVNKTKNTKKCESINQKNENIWMDKKQKNTDFNDFGDAKRKKRTKVKTLPGLFDEYDIEIISDAECWKNQDKLFKEFPGFQKTNNISNLTKQQNVKTNVKQDVKQSNLMMSDKRVCIKSIKDKCRYVSVELEQIDGKTIKTRQNINKSEKPVSTISVKDKSRYSSVELEGMDENINVGKINILTYVENINQNLETKPKKRQKKHSKRNSSEKENLNSNNNNDDNDEVMDIDAEIMNIDAEIMNIDEGTMNINQDSMNIDEEDNTSMNSYNLKCVSPPAFQSKSYAKLGFFSSSYDDGGEDDDGDEADDVGEDEPECDTMNISENTTLQKILSNLRQIGSQSSPIVVEEEEEESPKLLSPTLSGVSELSSLSEEQEPRDTVIKQTILATENKVTDKRLRNDTVSELFQEISPQDEKKNNIKQRRLATSNKELSCSNFGVLFHAEDIFL